MQHESFVCDIDSKQENKEKACLLGIQRGFGLVRRGREIHGLYPDGRSVLISRSIDIDDVWKDALCELAKIININSSRRVIYERNEKDNWL